MKNIKYRFLEKVCLGRDKDFSNKEKIIAMAYRDTLSAGRFYELPKNIK